MSVTIEIADYQAVLADGRWRSANALLAELLNNHLANLELPAHYPPGDLELLAAQAAVRDFGAQIIDHHLQPADPSRMPDGRLKVY